MTTHMTTTADGDNEQTVHLPDGPRAAAVARNATRDVLGRWRLSSVLEDVLLAVSELVTNAVLHGKPKVWLVLRRRQAHVHVAVHDDRPMPDSTMRGSRTDDAESGRGLRIVDIISDGVSFEDVPGDGKFAHASFPTTPDAAPTDNGRTSRRS
jgi:anti-sigma regulatory factor (Ser/Thr protein kinase)